MIEVTKLVPGQKIYAMKWDGKRRKYRPRVVRFIRLSAYGTVVGGRSIRSMFRTIPSDPDLHHTLKECLHWCWYVNKYYV